VSLGPPPREFPRGGRAEPTLKIKVNSQLFDHERAIRSLVFNGDGRLLVTGGNVPRPGPELTLEVAGEGPPARPDEVTSICRPSLQQEIRHRHTSERDNELKNDALSRNGGVGSEGTACGVKGGDRERGEEGS
jgi:hypothetical protein